MGLHIILRRQPCETASPALRMRTTVAAACQPTSQFTLHRGHAMTRQALQNHGKAGRPKKSQTAPKIPGAPAGDVTPDDKFVLLCDWQGHVVWGSMTFEQLRIGDVAWSYLAEESRELAREAVARVVTLREHRSLEI